MPDNITAPAVGAVLATDQIGEVHYPLSKVVFGADGAATQVSASNPLPVSLITGFATAAKQDDLIAAIEGISPGGGSGGDASAANQVTGNNLLASIDASLDAAVYFPATQPVSGTVSINGTVPVSGALTDTQLRATALPVSGSVAITGPVAVTGAFFPATQPISAETLPLPSGAATQATLASLLAKTIAAPATEAKQDANTAAIVKLGSGKRWFAIAPADTALATVPDAIYVGGAGNIVARGSDGVDATFAVVAGQTISISPAQVRAASTATGLIGLVS